MASRYWVGGTTTWNGTAGTKWALTDGGAGGQAVPTSADDVFFTATSGTVIVTVSTVNANAKTLTCTGFTGELAGASSILVPGDVILGSGMTWSNTGTLNITGTGSPSLTSNGISITSNIQIDTTGTVTLQDNWTTSANFIHNTGTVDLNNKNVTSANYDASPAGTKTLTMGSGTWTLTGLSTVWSAANLTTLNAGTSTIKVTNTSASTCIFAGSGKTYSTVWLARGTSSGINTISGSNTFAILKDTGTVAHTTRFTAGTTQIISTASGWQISGNSGQLITINSTTTGTHTLSCASGNISADYLNIQHSVAQGGASWYAGANSTNNQATATAGSGWIFTAPPGGSVNARFLAFM